MSLREIQQKIAPILRDYGVRRASVFGSMARQEHTDSSDVDILIEIGTPMGLITYSRLARELEEALGVSVDLVTPGSLNAHLRQHIERDLTPVYEG
jgi:predicted nucleotidyltransferase